MSTKESFPSDSYRLTSTPQEAILSLTSSADSSTAKYCTRKSRSSAAAAICFTRVDLPLPTGPVIPTAEGLGNPPPRRSSRTLIPVGSKAVTIRFHRLQRVKRIVPGVRLRLQRMSLRLQVHSYFGNRKTKECFQWRDKLLLTAPGSHPLPRTSLRQHTSRLTSLGLMAMMFTGMSFVQVTRAGT